MIHHVAKVLPLAVAGLLSACTTYAEPEGSSLDIARVAPGEISERTLKDVTRTLSSDEFEGRMPGTVGEEKTVAYLIDRFAKAGLQPGNNGSWTQDVPLVEITGSDFSELRIGGPAADMRFAPSKDYVAVTYREAPSIAIADSELVFVGYGIVAPERGWNDYAGIDMKGKTAIILVNDPDYETEGLDGPFNGRAMTYYGRWTYKYEEAARQGAAAALIVHDTFPAAYGWNVVESSWTGPQAFAQTDNGNMDETMANGWVQKGVAEAIMKAAGTDLATLSAAAKTKGFKPVPLGLTASLGFRNDIRKYASQNVIAMLPGSERPDEVVMHTAHWDHLGRCTPDATGDDICNGAVDNATGTAALVALGEAHAKAGPADRSLVFLAVTAEEQGLLGAAYYAANPVFPLASTVGGVNMDAIRMYGPARDITVVGGGKSELDRYVGTALDMVGRRATPESTPEKGFYYRSDHFEFAKRGVPMVYLKDGEDLLDGGVEAGKAKAAAYNDQAYHGPNDEYREDWPWGGFVDDVELYYLIGRMLAEGESWPNWLPGDEFRAIRDKSCAASAGGC
ncbi:M28 family peptidase [Qipengyuania oceanensis]|uniref:M28 family peptidase n=1 Tax=Qipengyuania oceanensis TaxID=1463597 RepID=A0A844YJ03_9SPHN|nr:M28 family peptidase [Qipengyuania oceanensis]MXO62924.1 M28 family peptidase [Qipengyuania oceanensis]